MRARIRSLAMGGVPAALLLALLLAPAAASASPAGGAAPASAPASGGKAAPAADGSSTSTQATPWADDPIQVYYPRRDCRGDWIELERWDREASQWRRHPAHDRIRVDSCQVEDAGYLLNEIRWRCVEPPESEPPPNWVVGLEIFDPDVMQVCGGPPPPEVWGDLELHVESPAPGERVSEPEMQVVVEGSVRMDGIDGTDYDVLLVIDRSQATGEGGADLLASQVEAGRALIEQLAPRLGPVRVGIVSYPNMPPAPGSPAGTAAFREIGLTDDAAALSRALDGVLRRGASGFQTFGSALQFALSELTGSARGSAARPRARKVLVMAADASGDRPFGRSAVADERFMQHLEERLESARRAHVSAYLFGMGGLSEELAPELAALLEQSDAHFHRVLRPSLDRPFFSVVPLPRVTKVVVENRTAGGGATPARVSPNGSFATTLVAAAGTNRVWARATLSDGETTEREWAFEFDDRLVRERLLAAEREHMRRVRQKRLQLEPMWDEELPPPPEEIAPDVAAEPPR